ncbi:MAG: enoyl-CoA hydratase/isomerase family protein [Salinirussus sp.]
MHVDDGPVRRVTFDRPESRNAMTAAVARELAEAFEGLDPDEHDAVVITGEGGAFSAGGDIEAMADRDETAMEAFERVRTTLGRVAERVLSAPVPVVAKVGGDAVGAGMTLVAAADLAYAGESARFGASFVNVGLVPDMGGTVVLPRVIGLRETKELAFTGRLLPATEAADLGLVNEAVPDEDLDGRVADVVATLRERPTTTVALTKRAIHDSLGASWREGLEREAHAQTLAYDTDAHAEGVAAFLEDRSPEFE